MKIAIKNKKSFALILAVFVLLAFSVTGMTAISLLSRKAANTFQIDSMRAFYAAEAARNYYLERISFANNFTAAECTPGNFTKTLSGTSFSISYTNLTARSATIAFTGTASPNNIYEITQLVQENSQNIAGAGSVPTLTIVDQVRRFNLMVWSSYNAWGSSSGTGSTIRIDRNCFNCHACAGGDGATAGQNFLANTYFNRDLYITGTHYVGCCTMPYYGKGRVAWGSTVKANNLYVNGNTDLSKIYSPTTNYGVFGTLYRRGYVTDTQGALHGSPTTVDCVANPTNSECMNWPTTAPTINRTYYNALITKAASSSIGTTLIDTASLHRQLNNRNIFFNGNVTITTTDALPLQGPGNIIATGNITISNNAFIRERVGLIAAGNITIGTSTRIGGAGAGAAGYDATNQLIIGAGVLIYSRGTVEFELDSKVKASCITGDLKFYVCRGGASCTGPCCATELPGSCYIGGSYAYSQFQGLAYADRMPADYIWYNGYPSHLAEQHHAAHIGVVYGNLLINRIPSDPGQACNYPTCQCWPPTGLGLGTLFDTFPAASGRGATTSELPLRIRGLYNLLITTPE